MGNANGFSQDVFTIINAETFKEYYSIVTARDINGRTIQFQVVIRNLIANKTDKKAVKPVKPPIVGTKVNAYFITGKRPVANYENINYKIIKPVYLEDRWYIIYKIDSSNSVLNGNSASIYASISIQFHEDGIGFKIWRPFPPDMQNFMGKAVYRRYYNRNEYFVLKPNNKIELDNNIFYSYISNVTTNPDPQATQNPPFQIPTSNQWEIVFGQNHTGNSSVNIYNFYNGEFVLRAFQINTNDDIFSFTQNRNPYLCSDVCPVWCDMEISGKRIFHVPMYGQTTTRIRAGTLNITSSSPWSLFDSSKINTIYNSTVPKKVLFPVGIYQLEMNGIAQQIELKDGAILNFSDSTSQPQTQKLNTLFNDKPWEIKPNLAARGATGRLFINIPKDAECVITISQPVTERQVVYSISDRSFSLIPGTYDVTVSGKKTKEVIVQKGMDTRIKGGVLNVVATGTWTLYDEKKDRQVYYSVSPKKIGLPVGTYQLEINGTMQQVIIKDGETVDF